MVVTQLIRNSIISNSKCFINLIPSSINNVSRFTGNKLNQQQLRCLCLTANRFSERRYHDKHEWVTVKDKIATVGISDHAQKALGDIVFVELPEPNRKVDKDDEVGCVESTKSANDIYSPLSGTIVEVNEKLESEPHLINSSPYDDGWIYKMEMSNEEEFSRLMDEESYKKFVIIQTEQS